MLRTTVFFDAATRARLRSLARRKGMTQAEVLREAIARYEAQSGSAGLAPGVGEFRSGDPATASRARALLRRAARAGSWRRR
jgi:predicted DNA-binding protein